MTELINKMKIKLELQTFIMILIFVFGLGGTYMSLKGTQKEILVKLDEISINYQTITTDIRDLVVTRDKQHATIDARLGYIMPTLKTLAMIYKLPVYEGL